MPSFPRLSPLSSQHSLQMNNIAEGLLVIQKTPRRAPSEHIGYLNQRHRYPLPTFQRHQPCFHIQFLPNPEYLRIAL